jgi:putative lipase involved disintegration of autophagic bodies
VAILESNERIGVFMKRFFAFCLIILLTALSVFADVLKPGDVVDQKYFKVVDSEYRLVSPIDIDKVNFLDTKWDRIIAALDSDADNIDTIYMVQYEKESIQEQEPRYILAKLSVYMIENGYEFYSDNAFYGFMVFKKYNSFEGILVSQSDTGITIIMTRDIRS